MKPLIYIAGPISKGDWMLNCRRALEIAKKLIDGGFAVYVPQLSIFWHLVFLHSQPSWWLDHVDYAILSRCDALIRLPGESVGADAEVAFCEQNKIPVYVSVEDLFQCRPILKPIPTIPFSRAQEVE